CRPRFNIFPYTTLFRSVPLDNSGHGAVDLVHRFQWVTPLMLSPHNPDVLYTAAECVFKSTDHGQNWTQISGDLTRNDKSKQQPRSEEHTSELQSRVDLV